MFDLANVRRYVEGQCIEGLRTGDGGAAVITLGDGHELVLRPVNLGGRAAILAELRGARPDDA